MSITSSTRRKARKSTFTVTAEPRERTANGSVQKTYWNGEPTPCRRVVVRVGTVERPTWWCAGMEGTERQAVEVVYSDQKFYLDNENGSAWLKVTLGYGGPEWGHKSLPNDSEVIESETA